tara:strand:- start:113 stop:574 length:462 start_codon:yes stop_codon:yes gene_type:complete
MKINLLCGLLIISTGFIAADGHTAAEKEAEKMLDLMGYEKMMEQTVSQMLDIQIQSAPGLEPFKGVMVEFFNKHMSYEIIKPEMIKIYVETFTASELREINAFYATDVGKKTIQTMPALMEQGAQLGASRVQENIGDLQTMIEAEAERLAGKN